MDKEELKQLLKDNMTIEIHDNILESEIYIKFDNEVICSDTHSTTCLDLEGIELDDD